MKTKILILVAAVALSLQGFAQLGTPMSQFSGNQIAYNPAYAGIYDMLSLNLTVHKSWVRIPGSPQLINFNGHAPFKNQRHAMGFVFQNEQWGPLHGNFILTNYSYKMYFDKSILSFGVQAGAMVHTVDWDKIDFVSSPEDPALGQGRQTEARFDVNAGVYYLAPQWYAGFSVMHISSPKYGFVEIQGATGLETWYSQMRPQFVFIGGYNIQASRDWSWRPEIFMRYVETTPLSTNIGLHAWYQNIYSLGANFMTGQKGVSFQAKAMLGDNLKIGYSYDAFWGDIRHYQLGSHEISISYMIRGIWDKARTVDLLWL